MTHNGDYVNLLSIKQFAQICRTTPRTLRFYEEKGLLLPIRIDQFTKYRYYNMQQTRDFIKVRLLHNFNTPLDDISRLIESNQIDILLDAKIKDIHEQLKEKELEYRFLKNIKHFMYDTDIKSVLKRKTISPFVAFCQYVDSADYHNILLYRKNIANKANQLHLITTDRMIVTYLSTDYKPKNASIEIAIVLKGKTIPKREDLPKGTYIKSFPRITSLTYDYYGPDEYLILIYQRIYDYLSKHQIKLRGNAFDIYESIDRSSNFDLNFTLAFPIE